VDGAKDAVDDGLVTEGTVLGPGVADGDVALHPLTASASTSAARLPRSPLPTRTIVTTARVNSHPRKSPHDDEQDVADQSARHVHDHVVDIGRAVWDGELGELDGG
jgi:hypothetical protein